MRMTLELTPEELTALTVHASADGVDIDTALHRLIAPLVQRSALEDTSAAAEVPELSSTRPPFGFRSSEAGDPDERAEHEREAQEMLNNLRRWREDQGRGAE